MTKKNTINNGEVENGAPLEDDFAKKKPANVVIHDVHGDVAGMEELRSQLHAHYQKEIEQVAKRLSDEYQGELDESLGKMEEEWEQQLERQKKRIRGEDCSTTAPAKESVPKPGASHGRYGGTDSNPSGQSFSRGS